MIVRTLFIILLFCFVGSSSFAEDEQMKPTKDSKHKMQMHHSMDMNGMVMNENKDRLPEGCSEIAGDVELKVHAGRKYARRFNGKIFAFDRQSWEVEPCSRINVTFINDDAIRHQFMVHGLPQSIYPPIGMFHIEVTGPGEKTASFIIPKETKTYLVHCELSQHMENGMKAQITVNGGDGDFPSVPGISKPETADLYAVEWSSNSYILALAAFVIGFLLVGILNRMLGKDPQLG